MRKLLAIAALIALALAGGAPLRIAQAASTEKTTEPRPDARTPAERMQRRFPQPVRVGDLIGLRVLDDEDRTLGKVKAVVRTPAGKIRLLVPYGGFLGLRQRLVGVPIEVVAIAGRQIAALDMTREEFDRAGPEEGQAQPIGPDETILIALYKR